MKNEKIVIEDGSKEINLLINSYNNMVDKLEESATILAQRKENAMARNGETSSNNEIKIQLTPMRLTAEFSKKV